MALLFNAQIIKYSVKNNAAKKPHQQYPIIIGTFLVNMHCHRVSIVSVIGYRGNIRLIMYYMVTFIFIYNFMNTILFWVGSYCIGL